MAKYRVGYEARFAGNIEVEAESDHHAILVVEELPYDEYVNNATIEDIEVEWADEVAE